MKEIIEQYGDLITSFIGIAATILLLSACWSVYKLELIHLLQSILVG